MQRLQRLLLGGVNTTQEQVAAKLDAQHHHGLINFGNTCYCNSVIQVTKFASNLSLKFNHEI